jgi:hypothetical protein
MGEEGFFPRGKVCGSCDRPVRFMYTVNKGLILVDRETGVPHECDEGDE